MAKIRFKFLVEKITFEYEGDHDTGLAVNRALNHTLGSLAEAQNCAISLTPEPQKALPSSSVPVRRKHRTRSKPPIPGHLAAEGGEREVAHEQGMRTRSRRSQNESFRHQTYELIGEGYFKQPRTMNELMGELSRRGFHYEAKDVASKLGWFNRKKFLSRDKNDEGKYAYVKGTNNDFSRGSGSY